MKPMFVLLIAFAVSVLVLQFTAAGADLPLAARTALSAMLLFTAMGHFAFSKGMALMVPPFLPARSQIVWITGVLEIIAAITLLIPFTQRATGWFLLVFFIVLLPANIYAAFQRLNYQTGNKDGEGPGYLWFRIPFQLILMLWVYVAAIL